MGLPFLSNPSISFQICLSPADFKTASLYHPESVTVTATMILTIASHVHLQSLLSLPSSLANHSPWLELTKFKLQHTEEAMTNTFVWWTYEILSAMYEFTYKFANIYMSIKIEKKCFCCSACDAPFLSPYLEQTTQLISFTLLYLRLNCIQDLCHSLLQHDVTIPQTDESDNAIRCQ